MKKLLRSKFLLFFLITLFLTGCTYTANTVVKYDNDSFQSGSVTMYTTIPDEDLGEPMIDVKNKVDKYYNELNLPKDIVYSSKVNDNNTSFDISVVVNFKSKKDLYEKLKQLGGSNIDDYIPHTYSSNPEDNFIIEHKDENNSPFIQKTTFSNLDYNWAYPIFKYQLKKMVDKNIFVSSNASSAYFNEGDSTAFLGDDEELPGIFNKINYYPAQSIETHQDINVLTRDLSKYKKLPDFLLNLYLELSSNNNIFSVEDHEDYYDVKYNTKKAPIDVNSLNSYVKEHYLDKNVKFLYPELAAKDDLQLSNTEDDDGLYLYFAVNDKKITSYDMIDNIPSYLLQHYKKELFTPYRDKHKNEPIFEAKKTGDILDVRINHLNTSIYDATFIPYNTSYKFNIGTNNNPVLNYNISRSADGNDVVNYDQPINHTVTLNNVEVDLSDKYVKNTLKDAGVTFTSNNKIHFSNYGEYKIPLKYITHKHTPILPIIIVIVIIILLLVVLLIVTKKGKKKNLDTTISTNTPSSN